MGRHGRGFFAGTHAPARLFRDPRSAIPDPAIPKFARPGYDPALTSARTVDRVDQSEKSVGRSRLVRIAIVGAIAIVIAHLLDPWMYRHVRLENIYSEDWGRLLRVLGYLPLWLVLAFALWLHERPRAWRRPAALALSPALAGIAGELLKLLLRRERPGAHEGLYYFRPFSERTFSSSGLALPSSHAVVAFGAAAILSRLFPRAAIVWWVLAWGCALSRVAAGAHFLSDVVVSAVVGWIAGSLVWRFIAQRQDSTFPAEVARETERNT